MKLWYFIKWCFVNVAYSILKFKFWQWANIVSGFWFGWAIFGDKEDTKHWLIAMLVFWGCAAIFTGIRYFWRKFNEEQQSIINTLKK